MIVIDVETTGLNPEEHSIVSLGAVEYGNPSNYFYGECRLKEGAKINSKALEVNGFTEEKINNAQKSCEELIKDFLNWTNPIRDKTLAGQNVQFDTNFLKQHFESYNIAWPFRYRFIDTHSIFYHYMLRNNLEIPLKEGVSSLSLDYMLETLKLEKRGQYHNALEDARLTRQIIYNLILEDKK